MLRTVIVAVILTICLVLPIVRARTAASAAGYEWQQYLDPDNNYLLSWAVANDTVSIQMKVKTTGWVGFGIGEQTSGSMPGADMAIAWIGSDGTARVSDRYATEKATPPEDDCQDWSIVSASQLSGVTTIDLTRALDTGDTRQDRPVECDVIMRVVWAYARDGSDTFGYHGPTNRGFTTMQFCGATIAPPDAVNGPGDGATAFELKMPSFAVPTANTYYACLRFSLPGPTVPKSLIQIDPIVHPEAAAHVHHFVLATARQSGGSTPTGTPSNDCSSMDVTFYAWAAGMSSWVAPSFAAHPVYNGTGTLSELVIQVHYDNPTAKAGVVDQSGVRLWMTPNLRPVELGMLQIGDPNLQLANEVIPSVGESQWDFTCNSGCTNLWPGSVTLVSSFLHMHLWGKRMWTSLYDSGGTYQRDLGRLDFWDNDRQGQIPLNVTLNPGDQLLTTCIFDTAPASSPVKFGLATDDEMCIDFLLYYPRSPLLEFCSYRKPPDNCTFCSAANGGAGGCAPGSSNNNPAFTEPDSLHAVTFGLSVNYTCPTTSPTLTVIGSVESDSSDSIPVAAIAGGVIGAVVVVVACVTWRVRNKRQSKTLDDVHMTTVR